MINKKYIRDALAVKSDAFDAARSKGYAEGFEIGYAEGYAEGYEIGRKEERLTTARRMKAKGFSEEDIADITGLTTEEIGNL